VGTRPGGQLSKKKFALTVKGKTEAAREAVRERRLCRWGVFQRMGQCSQGKRIQGKEKEKN